eukprot:12865564-Alexandrium_andersonii.AAC.1
MCIRDRSRSAMRGSAGFLDALDGLSGALCGPPGLSYSSVERHCAQLASLGVSPVFRCLVQPSGGLLSSERLGRALCGSRPG